jgi:hypothetical protein
MESQMKTKFSSGTVVITNGAAEEFRDTEYLKLCLSRHLSGDWGALDEEDKAQNEEAISSKGQIMSSYENDIGTLWIITDGGHETTTILLPSEY